MKYQNIFNLLISLLMCLWPTLFCTEDSIQPPLSSGSFYTISQGIFNEHHQQLLLRGVNIPNMEDSTLSDYQIISDWGMNTVRLLFMWSDLEPSQGEYDESFLQLMDEEINHAQLNNIYIILDMHQHYYGEGFLWGAPRWTCDESYYESWEPTGNPTVDYFADEIVTCFELFWTGEELLNQYADMWVFLADRYKDYSNIIGFDLMNEPFCAHTSMDECGELISNMYERVASRIHSQVPNKLILFEPNYVEYIGTNTNIIAPSFNNAVYAPHYYLMSVHNGEDYDLNVSPIRNQLQMRAEEAQGFNTPMFLGEFGGMPNVANFNQYIVDHLDIMDEYLMGSTYWLHAKGSGFHTLDSEGEVKEFVQYLSRPYPKAVPGRLLAVEFDQQTKEFVCSLEADTNIIEPGILSLPSHHYPAGFQLMGCVAPKCSWEYNDEEQLIEFRIQQKGIYTITITP